MRRIIGTPMVIICLTISFCYPASPRPRESIPQDMTALLQVPFTEESLHLDGKLDEKAWTSALTIELPFEIDPGENLSAMVKTECLVVSSRSRLYVAFRAHDSDPSSIRAHYMDRDAAWEDDWVFITIDPFFDQRRGFQFIANPLGVQMDSLLNEIEKGESKVDPTWDAIWESAGRLTADGYVVETAIPFASLRFPRGGGEQKWGFQAMRHYPRKFAYFFRATPWNRNRDCMLCENLMLVGFAGASPGRNVEINPTLTGHRTDARRELLESDMEGGKLEGDAGLSIRWGVTPSISLNAAANPDFSQVEADAAQLDVNIRFALFYPEKRPFFLEGADLFRTQLGAFYSRTLADPRGVSS